MNYLFIILNIFLINYFYIISDIFLQISDNFENKLPIFISAKMYVFFFNFLNLSLYLIRLYFLII